MLNLYLTSLDRDLLSQVAHVHTKMLHVHTNVVHSSTSDKLGVIGVASFTLVLPDAICSAASSIEPRSADCHTQCINHYRSSGQKQRQTTINLTIFHFQ